MDAWELSFYTDLGRYVNCPRCGHHSDLGLDRPEALDDWLAYARGISTELAKNNCMWFHQDSLLAWLWFKHHLAHPASESPDFDHSLDGLVEPLPTNEHTGPPEDNEGPALVLA